MYHSKKTPSHHISIAPIAVYARSIIALPKLLTPCIMPPHLAANVRKLSALRCRFPSVKSLRSFPRSQEKIHLLGACAGMGGIPGLRRRGSETRWARLRSLCRMKRAGLWRGARLLWLWGVVDDETDGDAEHGEDVCVVDRAWYILVYKHTLDMYAL